MARSVASLRRRSTRRWAALRLLAGRGEPGLGLCSAALARLRRSSACRRTRSHSPSSCSARSRSALERWPRWVSSSAISPAQALFVRGQVGLDMAQVESDAVEGRQGIDQLRVQVGAHQEILAHHLGDVEHPVGTAGAQEVQEAVLPRALLEQARLAAALQLVALLA